VPLGQTAPDGRPRRRPTLSAGNFRNSAGEKLISAAEQAGSADYYRSAGAGRSSRGRCADRPTLPGTGPGNRVDAVAARPLNHTLDDRGFLVEIRKADLIPIYQNKVGGLADGQAAEEMVRPCVSS
jgi:hypothetical protein